jgi:hypothetical protein
LTCSVVDPPSVAAVEPSVPKAGSVPYAAAPAGSVLYWLMASPSCLP